MNFKSGIIIILFFFCSQLLSAQSLHFQNLNIETGLSSNFVRTIFKDSQGLMWFGTDTGLDRYDGLQLINYAKRFKSPLKGAVQSITEYKPGILIVGTSWGAFLYDINRNHIAPIDFGISSMDTRFVFVSSKGKIWLATDKGLYSLNPADLKTTLIPLNGKLVFSVNCILEDKESNIWIGGREGLFEIKPDNKIISHLSDFTELRQINTLKFIDKSLYLGTQNGLYSFNIRNKLFSLIRGTKSIPVLSLTSDDKGNLLIGTDNAGLLTININDKYPIASANKQFDLNESSSKSIYALFYDKSDILWEGTFDNGVNFTSLQTSKKFRTIEFQGSANANIRSIYFDSTGEKYIGTRDGSIFCLDADNKIKTKTGSLNGRKFRSNILTTIYPFPGKPEILLIGTFGGGITLFNKKTYVCSNFSDNEVFQNGTTYKFCTDKNNQLWIATLDGLYNYNPVNQTFHKTNITPVTGSNEIFTISTDNKDRIWIGTKTGVCYYSLSEKKIVQPQSCKTYRFQCTATMVDSKGNIWFCFNKGGVLELGADLKEKSWLTNEIGLPENAPSSLMEDRNGNIWIGSSKGLFKVANNKGVHTYGFEDGLTGIGFCPQSATQDAKGNLWWSNDKGLVTFINDKTGINNQPPVLKLTDLFINGQRYDTDTLTFVKKIKPFVYKIEIKGKSNNNLEFRVAALNFKNARRNQYSFFLEGVDSTWNKASTNPVVAYSQLSPGTYILKIRASNNDDVWTPVPSEIRFIIHPFFYETIWFTALIWIIVISILLYFTRTYILRMKNRILTQFDEIKKKQNNSATLKITEQKGNEIREKLLDYMAGKKAFLNPELRQADVATALGYSVHEISQVLNVQLNQNFSDFVNSYRIEEVKIRMLTDDAKKYTLSAVAMQCGFNAKSSFLRAFKKATNMTPSIYFRGIKID